MTDDQRRAEAATRDLASLKREHDQFILAVNTAQSQSFNCGWFRTDGENFSAEVLGVRFRVNRRPVAVNGNFVASEYAFLSEFEGEDLPVWRLYLNKNDELFTDSSFTQVVCKYTNSYLIREVIVGLTNALLKSPIFAPKA